MHVGGRKNWIAIAAVAVFGSALFGSSAHAAIVSVPYENDFSASVADFVETTDAQWTLNTTTGKYRNIVTGVQVASSAMLTANGLGGSPLTAEDFVVRTSFILNNLGGPASAASTVGIAALSADTNSSDNSGGYYLADVQMTGNIRLVRVNSNVTLAQVDTLSDLVTGVAYDLTLTGTYAANGDLALGLTVSGNNQTSTVTATVLQANVLQIANFGLRNRVNHTTSATLDVEFDNFSINATPVPEPSSLLLGMMAVAGLTIAWRRRRQSV